MVLTNAKRLNDHKIMIPEMTIFLALTFRGNVRIHNLKVGGTRCISHEYYGMPGMWGLASQLHTIDHLILIFIYSLLSLSTAKRGR